MSNQPKKDLGCPNCNHKSPLYTVIVKGKKPKRMCLLCLVEMKGEWTARR
jgi:hypothetical protein